MELTGTVACVLLFDAYLTSICHALKTPFQAYLEENDRIRLFTRGWQQMQ